MTRNRMLLVGSMTAVVLAVLVVADRAAAAVLEDRLAERLRCLTGMTEAPDVDVEGFPVLNQLVAGRLDQVEVAADHVPLGTARLTHVEARATQVWLSDGALSAGRLTVFVTMSYPDLAQYTAPGGGAGAAPDLRIVGGDDQERLILRADVLVDGRSEPATVYAGVTVVGNWLVVAPDEAELPTLDVGRPADRVSVREAPLRLVGLPELPRDVTYWAAGGAPDGLQMMAGGTNVQLRDPEDCAG